LHIDGRWLTIGDEPYRALIRALISRPEPEAVIASDKLALATRPHGGYRLTRTEAAVVLAALESLPTPIDPTARLDLGRLRDTLVVIVNPEDV
jgi:hypothetical protein